MKTDEEIKCDIEMANELLTSLATEYGIDKKDLLTILALPKQEAEDELASKLF
jgi:hypothetical protein